MPKEKNIVALAKSFAAIHKTCFGNPGTKFSSSFILSLIENPNVKFIEQEQKGFCLARLSNGEAEIITMAIKPEFQQKGIGYSILIKTIQLIEKTSCKTIFLEVASDNVAGIRLYSKAGFNKCGIRKNYYQISNGKKADAIIMKKTLVE